MAEGGCCPCGRRWLSPGWQRCAQCILQHSQGSPTPAAPGCAAPAALKGPALTLALWRGIQSQTTVGHRASAESAQHSPSSRVHSHRGVLSPQKRRQLSVSKELHCSPCGSAPPSRSCVCLKPCEHTHQVPSAPGLLAKVTCPTRSQGRHSSACCPQCSCPQGNPKGFQRKIAQSGIYSPTPLWASGFLPASSFPTVRST